jgi:CHAT domain-containing protein
LIASVLPYLDTKLLYISADNYLNYLPFEALKKDGRFLVEDFAVAYTPSASVLKFCLDKNRYQRETVLALGNPNLKNPAFRLVHAENEVNGIKGLFPKVDVYAGDAATEAVVKLQGVDYDILHFACHGELNLDDPMLTSLRLAPDAENDGYLHAGEVFDCDLTASLVVLSACNSALGELTSGNELMGLKPTGPASSHPRFGWLLTICVCDPANVQSSLIRQLAMGKARPLS